VKRVVISLDPEYLPWEGDVVKLLHKRRSPWVSILVSLALLAALGGYWGYRAYAQRAPNAGFAGVATPAPEIDALPTPGGESVIDTAAAAVSSSQSELLRPAIILALGGAGLLCVGIIWRRRTLR
jgi:hypothetical protein